MMNSPNDINNERKLWKNIFPIFSTRAEREKNEFIANVVIFIMFHRADIEHSSTCFANVLLDFHTHSIFAGPRWEIP